MKIKSHKYFVLVLLICMFAAPGILAYILYQNPHWLGKSRVNRGVLLNPPVLLDAFSQQKKWHVVFWSPASCGEPCLQGLDTLARVRLALGRKLYDVDQWLILKQDTELSTNSLSLIDALSFKIGHLPENNQAWNLFSQPKIFIADPNNYLILSYSLPINPNDVYKDLKLLLNIKENKKG